MVLKKSELEKGIFVIMPFEKTETRNQEQLTSFFETNIKGAIENSSLENKYFVWRSGEKFNITDEIIRDLYKADIVIADLSGIYPNPNVMYELGVRLALCDKPVILIREKNPKNKKVFDVDSYYIYPYDPLSYSRLGNHLIDKLKRFETKEEAFESPIKRVLHDALLLSFQSTLSNLSPQQQKDIIVRGALLLNNNISVSFGPMGQGIPMQEETGRHRLLKRGVEISSVTMSSNPLENRGIQFMHQVATTMAEKVGDGSKLGILLTTKMIEVGKDALGDGHLPKSVIAGMEKAIVAVCEYIDKCQFSIKQKRELVNVASTAAKNKTAGEIIGECLEKGGKYGSVRIEESENENMEVEIIEGMHFDRGYLSSEFVAEPEGVEWVAEECYVFCYPRKIELFRDIIPLMEKVVNAEKPLLIIAQEVSGEALDTLLVNVRNGVLKCMVVKLPGHGSRSLDILEDIAVATGAKILSAGFSILNVAISHLGVAQKVVVSRDECRILAGGDTEREVRSRVNKISEMMSATRSLYDAEIYQERQAMLMGATAIVRVGGVTKQEIDEKRYGFYSALNSAISSVANGALVGGGVSLLRGKDVVQKITPANAGEAAGINAVLQCLEIPTRCLALSCGVSADDAIARILSDPKRDVGVNVNSGTIEDLKGAGILDSSAVIKAALEVALGFSKMFLESSSWLEAKNK